MTRYRSRVTEIDAFQWLGPESWDGLYEFVGPGALKLSTNGSGDLFVPVLGTLSGLERCKPGDWLTRSGDSYRVLTDAQMQAGFELAPAPQKRFGQKPEKLTPGSGNLR